MGISASSRSIQTSHPSSRQLQLFCRFRGDHMTLNIVGVLSVCVFVNCDLGKQVTVEG